MRKLLLVEDDEALIDILEKRLSEEGFDVVVARSSASALEKLREGEPPILALIDIGLPDEDGFRVAREISLNFSTLPFVFLTAMGSPEYRLEGYELGARDYIPKPFHFKELLLRIHRIIGEPPEKKALRTDAFTLDPETREFSVSGQKAVPLPEREFFLLYRLVECSPRIVTREEVLEEIWGTEKESANSRAVDNSILRLRQALGDELSSSIRSVRGAGYQWVRD